MDAKELQRENQRLMKLLARAQQNVSELSSQLSSSVTTVSQQESTILQFEAAVSEKQQTIASLEHQIKLLLQHIKGSRQERINPDQLLLFSLEELEELVRDLSQDAEGDLIDEQPKRRRKRSRGRCGQLPSHLQRDIVRHELDTSELSCPCCGETRAEIGVVSSEQLEIIPAQLKVLQHDRVKYACPHCEEHVVTASKPPQPIEKGLPGPGLCAHTVLSKFGDHCVQGEAVSKMRVGLSRSSNRTWLQTGPNCDGQEPWWEALG